jgi:glyoxylase-like metal-dependent hydrolase (beta-lactamase superfamily II)
MPPPPVASDRGAPPREEADHTFITTFFHARDARGRVWAPKQLVRRLKNRGVEVTDPFEPGDRLPAGIQAFESGRDGEVVYWVPGEQTLVVGDVLLGSPFRLCPKSGMGKGSHDDLKAALRPLLDLPIARIHVGHGEPVEADGRAALADLL